MYQYDGPDDIRFLLGDEEDEGELNEIEEPDRVLETDLGDSTDIVGDNATTMSNALVSGQGLGHGWLGCHRCGCNEQ